MSVTRPINRRAGFTLVELLVVISIIAVLSALLTVGLYAAYNTSRSFVLSNEVTQVSAALEQFKSAYGCYPPDMTDFNNSTLSDAQLNSFNAFINKAYPRADRVAISNFRQWVLTKPAGRNQIDQAEALVLFLSLTSSDPRYPLGSGPVATFSPPAPNSLKVFYEFPAGSLVDSDLDSFPEFVQKNAKGAPLIYFDARTYTQPAVLAGTAQVGFAAPTYINTTGVVAPYASAGGPPYVFFNPKSYQLISAGLDGEFGVDTSSGIGYPILNPAAPLALPRLSDTDGDNVANFTSGKKFDSLPSAVVDYQVAATDLVPGAFTMKRRARKSTSRAFTLIELMLVMGMMAILMAATGLALAQAMEQGRVSRTQAQVARIHSLLMTRYDSYRTKSIRLVNSIGIQSANPSWSVNDQLMFNRQRRVDRLRAIRMTIRLEMPDNLRDLYDVVSGNPVAVYDPAGEATLSTITLPDSGLSISTTIRRPALSDSYFRRVQVAMANFSGRFATTDNAPSECLYLILSSIQDGDTNGLDFLLPSEIGDTDQDGIPEILDAWGRPIFYFRWAPGMISPVQNHLDADPFDPLLVDSRSTVIDPVTGHRGTYAMVPLVYSAGPDGFYGFAYNSADIFTYSAGQPPLGEANDPFCTPPPLLVPWGTIAPNADGTEGWHDNIMSHFLSSK